MFENLDDEIKAEDQLYLESKKEEEKKAKEEKFNEFGDRIGKKEICQGILLFGAITGIITCACIRGCQEIKKIRNEKAKNILIQNNNQNMR